MSDENDKVQEATTPGSANELEKTIQERDEYLNGWKRAKADLINYKKEEDKRFKEIADFATLGLVKELLAGMDSFDLALSATADAEVRRGIAMIKSQFDEILKRQGVSRIETHIGTPPDPRFHEAISEVESPGKEGMIVSELVAGYQMGDKVIRAAKVQIGK